MQANRLNAIVTASERSPETEHPGFIAFPVPMFGQMAVGPWTLYEWAFEQARAQVEAVRGRRDLFAIMN